MELKKLNDVVNQFGAEFIDKMKQELDQNGSIATGKLKTSVNYVYTIETEQIIMQFLSEDYGKYVEGGRQAGSYPNMTNLEKWISVKGLPEKALFPIAKSIYKYGIKPKPFMMQDFEAMKHRFVIALIAAYGDLVKVEVMDMLNQLPKQIP